MFNPIYTNLRSNTTKNKEIWEIRIIQAESLLNALVFIIRTRH